MDKDKKTEIIVFIIMLFLAGFFINKEESLTCDSKYSYCKTLRTNFYNFSSTTNLWPPQEIEVPRISSYQVREGGRRHRRTVTRYELRLVSKSGSSNMVFKGYSTYGSAERKGQEIMECIKQEKYPCKIKKY